MHRATRTPRLVPAVLLILLSWALPSIGEEPSAAETPPFDLYNGRQIHADLLVGGQPTAEQIQAMAEVGYRSVVNLRSEGEKGTWEEAPLLEELGLSYLHLPVAGGDDLTPELAHRLAAWLDDPEHLPALVHCGSSNRVGALFALKAFHVDGQDAEEAIEIGRQHGLKGLEAKVEPMLADSAAMQKKE